MPSYANDTQDKVARAIRYSLSAAICYRDTCCLWIPYGTYVVLLVHCFTKSPFYRQVVPKAAVRTEIIYGYPYPSVNRPHKVLTIQGDHFKCATIGPS